MRVIYKQLKIVALAKYKRLAIIFAEINGHHT